MPQLWKLLLREMTGCGKIFNVRVSYTTLMGYIGLCKSSSVPNEAQMLIVGPIEEVREGVRKEVDYT